MDYRYKEDIPAGLLRDSIISYGPLGPLLTLGDRVVWVLRDGPQFGWVRWVGRLPDVTDDGWTIGVEFVSAKRHYSKPVSYLLWSICGATLQTGKLT